jgi:putative Mg2+ transporter-C (MgtC) family protein
MLCNRAIGVPEEHGMGWWEQIWDGLRSDFADLPDIAGTTQIVVRLLFAAILGGVLGYEREMRGKTAGMRTHMLVALGAAFFVIVPQKAGFSEEAVSRVLQGLIAGIGFLGAGVILKRQDAGEIMGLTTAASVWLTAAVGVAVGMGRLASAILATGTAFLILDVIPHVTRWRWGERQQPK